MSSGLDLRKRVVRKDPPKRDGKGKENPSPLSAIDAGSPGEIKISSDTLYALNHLYHASPSIQAARTILLGQLLSSGCVVRRDGRDVPLKDTFARHLHDVWVPFAKTVIDHFLQFGFVIVSLEEEAPAPFANFIRGKAMAAQSEMGPDAQGYQNRRKDPPDQSQLRAQKRPISASSDQKLRTPARSASAPVNLVPVVPDVGQCELSFIYVGESNYRRQYRIFSTNSDSVYKQDFSSEVFFRSPPDAAGNVCSPIATVFQSASFISALEELALQAEVVRARQMLVTQPITRTQGSQNLDPANLFFDAESRAVQASATAEDDAAVAQNLAVQAKMMATINRLQTTDMSGGRPGGSSSVPSHVPPPLPPNLFACPGTTQRPHTLRCAPLTPRVLVWQTGSRWCRACGRPRPARTSWTSCASSTIIVRNRTQTRHPNHALMHLQSLYSRGGNGRARLGYRERVHIEPSYCLEALRFAVLASESRKALFILFSSTIFFLGSGSLAIFSSCRSLAFSRRLVRKDS